MATHKFDSAGSEGSEGVTVDNIKPQKIVSSSPLVAARSQCVASSHFRAKVFRQPDDLCVFPVGHGVPASGLNKHFLKVSVDSFALYWFWCWCDETGAGAA